MTTEQLERDLSAWFVETAGRGTPEFAEDILLETSGIRQRPRWTFVPLMPRPMDRSLRRGVTGLAPGRRLALVAVVVGLLVLGASAVWVASQPRLPAPFGPAANGLVAYEKGGDIFVVDPATGERSGLVIGPEVDRDPRWSLDGTRLAFLRWPLTGGALVIVDASGVVQSVSSGMLPDADPDSIAWAPDGRSVVVAARFAGEPAIFLIDAFTGQSTVLPVPYRMLEAYWRPPEGRELLFMGGEGPGLALYRYSLAGGAITEVPGTRSDDEIRPIGWTPDGRRFAYSRSGDRNGGVETAVVDVETGDEVVLDVAYGRISNDGTRIVGMAWGGPNLGLCVAPVDGGPCESIGGDPGLVDPWGWASFQWAPDDTSIRSRPGSEGPAVLFDPDGREVEWPSWAAEGADSWQRRAP
jgi:dipeptidyl aminopeptidase/acylaminoacyl peptidase